MKIKRVTAHPLVSPLATPFAFSQGWVSRRCATIVEIETADGSVGWGEAFAQGLEPPQIAAAVVEHALAPLLAGEDAFATEVLWHRMYHATRDFGRKGTVIAAISAVDMALWDLAGKAYGQPVHRLLGGAFRQRDARVRHRLLPQGRPAARPRASCRRRSTAPPPASPRSR